jgi:hypothetical protein
MIKLKYIKELKLRVSATDIISHVCLIVSFVYCSQIFSGWRSHCVKCIGGIGTVWILMDSFEGCILSFLVVQPCIGALTKIMF